MSIFQEDMENETLFLKTIDEQPLDQSVRSPRSRVRKLLNPTHNLNPQVLKSDFSVKENLEPYSFNE